MTENDYAIVWNVQLECTKRLLNSVKLRESVEIEVLHEFSVADNLRKYCLTASAHSFQQIIWHNIIDKKLTRPGTDWNITCKRPYIGFGIESYII